MDNRYCKKFELVRDEILQSFFNKASAFHKQKNGSETRNSKDDRYKRQLALQNHLPAALEKELSAAFAAFLSQILKDIAIDAKDPVTAMNLLAEFYETDEQVFAYCDDNEGVLAGIYLLDAKDLFVEYGISCTNKEAALTAILRICQDDSYRVRSTIFNNVSLFLEEKQIRTLIKEVQQFADREMDIQRKYYYIYMVNCFARQIEDNELYDLTLMQMKNQSYDFS